MKEKYSQEKLIKVAQALGINTLGKSEDGIQKNILEQVTPKPESKVNSDFSIDGFIRGLGRTFREFDQIKKEFTGEATNARKSFTGEVTNARKSITSSVKVPMPLDNTFRLARVLGINIQGKGKLVIQNEIKKMLEI